MPVEEATLDEVTQRGLFHVDGIEVRRGTECHYAVVRTLPVWHIARIKAVIRFFLMLASLPAFAQTSAVTGDAKGAVEGVVEGVVRNSVTKAPIAGARIQLRFGEKEEVRKAVSDAQGKFQIGELPSGGPYRLIVRHDDYSALDFDHPAARPFTIDPTAKGAIKLQPDLVPDGAVAGRVLHPNGEAMKGVTVGLRTPWGPIRNFTISGDRGEFRISQVPPGAWILAALPTHKHMTGNPDKDPKPPTPPGDEEGVRMSWVPTYFPGVTHASDAAKILVQPGVTAEGLQIKLLQAPIRRVGGVVIDEDGKGAAKAVIFWSNGEGNGSFHFADENGRFEVDTITDGEWTAYVQYKRGEQLLKGYAAVHVSRRDIAGLEIRVFQPFSVTGTVVRDQPLDRDGKRSVTSVYLIPEGMPEDLKASGFHEQDGRLVIPNVYAGRYRVLPVGFLPGFFVDAVYSGDRDVTTQAIDIASPPPPLRIVYGKDAPRVTGTVERGEDATVVLVPENEALREASQFIRTVRCDAHGRFAIGSLRPGGYYALAFPRIAREALENAGFVRRLTQGATRVELRAGESANVELKAQPWPDY